MVPVQEVSQHRKQKPGRRLHYCFDTQVWKLSIPVSFHHQKNNLNLRLIQIAEKIIWNKLRKKISSQPTLNYSTGHFYIRCFWCLTEEIKQTNYNLQTHRHDAAKHRARSFSSCCTLGWSHLCSPSRQTSHWPPQRILKLCERDVWILLWLSTPAWQLFLKKTFYNKTIYLHIN